MSGEVPEGWYADPQDRAPGAERWWNGHSWTAHTRQRPVEATPPSVPAPPTTAAAAPTVLADGTPLAPLGARLGAYAIDVAMVWFVAGVLLSLVSVAQLLAVELSGLDAFGLVDLALRPLLVGGLWVGYQLFVLTRGTPSVGKRLLGLEVRRLDPAPGARAGLDSSTALSRALASGGGVALVMFPGSQLLGVGLLGVDAYRMQQDRLRRPWHDQLAGTVVVQPSLRSPAGPPGPGR